MSVVAPFWIAIAGLVAAGVVVVHLITISQPRRDVLPTVRFIPQTAPLAVTRTRTPQDLVLLLLRLLAVSLLGLALAGAHVTRRAPARVIIADLSRATGDTAAVRDSIRAVTSPGGGGVVVTFGDAVGPATLSGALVAAHRVIAGRDGRDRTELVIVSPLLRRQLDSASASLLGMWPGAVRLARVRAAVAPHRETAVRVLATGDDPVAAVVAAGVMGRGEGGASVRLFRSDPPTRADSLWARDSAGALVVWPARLSSGSLVARRESDRQQGIAAGRQVVVGNFARTHVPRDGRALVRWLDGEPAATEAPLDAGCVRDVAIPVDAAGDVALRTSFRGIIGTLISPCGEGSSASDDSAAVELATLLPAGDRTRTTTATVADVGRLPVWLALVAFVVLIAEQAVRRGRTK